MTRQQFVLPLVLLVSTVLSACRTEHTPNAATRTQSSTLSKAYSLTEQDVSMLIQVETARQRELAELERQRLRSPDWSQTDGTPTVPSPAAGSAEVAGALGIDPDLYRRADRRLRELRVARQVNLERASRRRFHKAHLATTKRLRDATESEEEQRRLDALMLIIETSIASEETEAREANDLATELELLQRYDQALTALAS